MSPWSDIVVSKLLPVMPSPGEVGRRIVRHGLADVLEWLGQKVGPKPDEGTHAIVGLNPAGPLGVVFVSEEYAAKLRQRSVLDDLASPVRATRQAAEAEWLRVHREHRAAVVAEHQDRADG